MSLKPIPRQLKIEQNKKTKTENKKKANPVKTSKSVEVSYRRKLLQLVSELRKDVSNKIIPLLKLLEPQYTSDSYSKTLEKAFDDLRLKYEYIGVEARIISNQFTQQANQANKKRFYAAIENAIGIDLSSIIANENLQDVLYSTTRENVALIKSIPEEYFKKIEVAVFAGTTRANSATSMIKQLQDIGRVTTGRAKLIARDQSSKLNAALTQKRSENLGSEEYIWRTAEDGLRVRESHRRKNGKIFRWDSPPSDTGHPGEDIQCRCVAQPILKI